MEFIQGKIDRISRQHVSKQHATAWENINNLTGRKRKPSIRIKGSSAAERKNSWLNHFQNLPGGTSTTREEQDLPRIKIADPLNISTESYSLNELRAVVKSIKVQKSPGLDNIPALIWKDPIFHDLLLDICNRTFGQLVPPSAWLKSGIIPIPKKGDLSLPTNYRGISSTSIAAKIYNRLLLNRIVPQVDPLLPKNQNGFRKGRSTISQILSLRRIIEEMRKHNRELTNMLCGLQEGVLLNKQTSCSRDPPTLPDTQTDRISD